MNPLEKNYTCVLEHFAISSPETRTVVELCKCYNSEIIKKKTSFNGVHNGSDSRIICTQKMIMLAYCQWTCALFVYKGGRVILLSKKRQV